MRVWESYRSSRSFGYGYESVTELPGVPGSVARAYRTHRSSGWAQKVLYLYPGYWGTGCTELAEVPGTGRMSYIINRSSGTGMKVLQNFQNFLVFWHGRTELTEVPGTGMNALQNLQKFRVGVIPG